jgi:glycine oxidase
LSVPLFGEVIHGPRCYLVPRDDGRVLVGSTLEFVGYRREVTAGAVRDLLDAAIELCPPLAGAALSGTWSSFRPYAKDGLPVIGRAAADGLVIATGHYRNGILLAPVTAEIVGALVRGQRLGLDVSAFSPAR